MRFSAPASSANLGPGFDCLGMALDLRNELELTPGSGRLLVRGEGEGSLPTDASNLVVRAFCRAAGTVPDAWDLACTNRIPLARGLGSSTAAAALGLMAGWHVAGVDWDARRLFTELAEIDGHPDNAAACAFGSLVVARGGTVVGLDAPGWLAPVVVVPDNEVPTERARAALPATYSRADVVAAIGNASVLVYGLLQHDEAAVAAAVESDCVHEPFRGQLVPELATVRAAIEPTPALGATISGAGPTVLVWATRDGQATVLATLEGRFAGTGTRVTAVDVTADGARPTRS